MPSIILKRGRERSVLRRHPWIFSGAVARVEGEPRSGDTVDVCGEDGTLLARGSFSPKSQIVVRVWTFDPGEEVATPLFRRRLEQSIARRGRLSAKNSARRLVNAESDWMPGLIVDRYDDFLVCEFLTAGVERWKAEIVEALMAILSPAGIFDRSEAGARVMEGLPPGGGVLAGSEPPEFIEIVENGCRFLVDVRNGHKTGFYLDQRENRPVAGDNARGADVLDCFSYTGSFAVHALKGKAKSVTQVESSAAMLDFARRNIELNGLDMSKVKQVEGDVFHVLRSFRDSRRDFDLIILDPPKFVDSRGHLERASRGYKDINLLAFKLLRPGGILMTFSCSGLMPADLFEKIVAGAALDAGRDSQVLSHLSQSSDHPISLSFPEGAYLKGLVCLAL